MADMDKEKQDVMSAQEILDQLRLLADSERQEGGDMSEADASHLDDAIASIEKFVEAEKGEQQPTPMSDADMAGAQKAGVVDTSTLTGPIGGLKNFLLKTQRDNESK